MTEQPKGSPDYECIECHGGIDAQEVVPLCEDCYLKKPLNADEADKIEQLVRGKTEQQCGHKYLIGRALMMFDHPEHVFYGRSAEELLAIHDAAGYILQDLRFEQNRPKDE